MNTLRSRANLLNSRGGHNQASHQGQQPHLPAHLQGGYKQAPQQGQQSAQQQNAYHHPQEPAPQHHNYNDQSGFQNGADFGHQQN